MANKKTLINPRIFRAYDIRGIAGKDLMPDTMYLIGQGCSTYLQKKYNAKNLVIGMDGRISGPLLQNAFIKGLLETGCNVLNIGAVTSPMVYWAACYYGFDGGGAITASHNPKDYNGLKLFGKNAHSICDKELQEILEIIKKEQFLKGKGVISEKDISKDYKNDIKSKISKHKPLKVAIDCGNGIAGPYASDIFRVLGHDVLGLYTDVDGNFPNHIANPEEEKNLKDLQKKVVSAEANIGIGFDGDGDRLGIIDEKGKFYSADYILILLARDLLKRHPKAKIIFDIKTSKIVENEIKRLNGIPIRHKTGHSFTEAKMREEKALLAGECSGHMFLKENYYGFDDAIFATAKILQILSDSKMPLSKHFLTLPKLYTTPEIKVPCSDEHKFQIVKNLIKDFKKDKTLTRLLTIDGAFVEFGDTDWGAVRASNTTPCLTLRFEASTKQKLEKIKKIFAEKMDKYKEIDSSWYN